MLELGVIKLYVRQILIFNFTHLELGIDK